MSKSKPAVRYFVAKFRDEKRGVHHRVIRRKTRKILGQTVHTAEHVYDRGAWKKTKAKYWQVSKLLLTRAQARAEKRAWDGR